MELGHFSGTVIDILLYPDSWEGFQRIVKANYRKVFHDNSEYIRKIN